MAPKKAAADSKTGPPSSRPASARVKSGDTTPKPKVVKKKASPVKKKVKKTTTSAEGAIVEEVVEELEEMTVADGEAEEYEEGAIEASDADASEKAADGSGTSTSLSDQLVAVLPRLKDAERSMRAMRNALPRAADDGPLSLFTLEQIEEEVCGVLNAMSGPEVAEVAPTVAALLDAGSNDFFGGHRGAKGMVVHEAARKALVRSNEAAPAEGDRMSHEMQTIGKQVCVRVCLCACVCVCVCVRVSAGVCLSVL